MTDHLRLLNDVLDEADQLIRRRTDERSDVLFPHLVAGRPGHLAQQRQPGRPAVLQPGSDELADALEAGPEPGDTTH
ncbi:hypothetical protein [Reyranella soli]|uniref:hypothetical protein n=1 Tax=Reyranella soli TaxID=1230389 RepID=UPI0014782459|nr:hypothetical protein [Reyranella soli]